jgi:hypothetical protein
MNSVTTFALLCGGGRGRGGGTPSPTGRPGGARGPLPSCKIGPEILSAVAVAGLFFLFTLRRDILDRSSDMVVRSLAEPGCWRVYFVVSQTGHNLMC